MQSNNIMILKGNFKYYSHGLFYYVVNLHLLSVKEEVFFMGIFESSIFLKSWYFIRHVIGFYQVKCSVLRKCIRTPPTFRFMPELPYINSIGKYQKYDLYFCSS